MAVQLVGVALLSSVITKIFESVVSFFVERSAKRLLIIAALLVALGGLVTGFMRIISNLVSGIGTQLPPEISQFGGYILPSNTIICLSAIITAHLVRWAYEWNIKVLQWKL